MYILRAIKSASSAKNVSIWLPIANDMFRASWNEMCHATVQWLQVKNRNQYFQICCHAVGGHRNSLSTFNCARTTHIFSGRKMPSFPSRVARWNYHHSILCSVDWWNGKIDQEKINCSNIQVILWRPCLVCPSTFEQLSCLNFCPRRPWCFHELEKLSRKSFLHQELSRKSFLHQGVRRFLTAKGGSRIYFSACCSSDCRKWIFRHLSLEEHRRVQDVHEARQIDQHEQKIVLDEPICAWSCLGRSPCTPWPPQSPCTRTGTWRNSKGSWRTLN
jgi:hypothetical protein